MNQGATRKGITIEDGVWLGAKCTILDGVTIGKHAIVAAGMGMRPFMGFTEAGIDVYFENETPRVGDVAELIAQGKVEKMTADNTCHH